MAVLSSIESGAHAPDVCAGKLSSGFNCGENALGFRKGGATIDGHDSVILTHVCIEQLARLYATRRENFVTGK